MAELGGLFKALMVIAIIISQPFTKLVFYIRLLNNIFIFEK